jgi:hypothetical protein
VTPFAHVGGIPVEETLTALPAVLSAVALGFATLRARWRRD